MPDPLKMNDHYPARNEPIAVPAFRVAVVMDGLLDVAATKASTLAFFDVFVSRFGDSIGHVAIDKAGASSGARLVKLTQGKLDELRAAIAADMTKIIRIRLYGTEPKPMKAPNLPYLSILRSGNPATAIEVCAPADLADLTGFAAATDEIIRHSPVRSGFQGFGFVTDFDISDPMCPAAFMRYRTAVMGEFPSSLEHLSFKTASIVNRSGEYTPGISDTGWRTYVGAPFRDRLGSPADLQDKGVSVEVLPTMTVVTAGPAPIWGDLNNGEDISGYQAAHLFVRPAYADRKWLVNFAPWSSEDAEMRDLSEAYIDRLLPEDAI